MVQEIKINAQDIVARLVKLQSDINFIKEKMNFVDEKLLTAEMEAWENASAEDSADFFDKHNL